ncbi:MAG TPA: hypothetical protein VFQ52_01515 [Rhizomicrobium sp.]|nr:hypothetical protein [Rhizomicrobium sp.]
MKKSLMTLVLVTVFGVPAAYAHGVQQQPSLLGALLSVGNHSVANVGAKVLSPSSLADVKLNVLGVVKANVDVGQSSRQGNSLLNLNASLLSGGVGNRQDRW